MDFQVVTGISHTLKPGAIERAIAHFVDDTKRSVVTDQDGRFNQLITFVYDCLVRKTHPDAQIWIKEDEDGEVGAFAFTNFAVDVDNKLSFWLAVAWVRKAHRFSLKPKLWFWQMQEFGRVAGAKHLLIPSVRGSKGYLRYIGKDKWHEYEVILKRDL